MTMANTTPAGGADTLAPTPTQPSSPPSQEGALKETIILSGAGDASIRPFQFHASDEELADLRRRINSTRWPERELVDDGTQGVQLALMQDLARYWANDYDWRRCEEQLNALPNFITEIDGLDIDPLRSLGGGCRNPGIVRPYHDFRRSILQISR
jgi:hypothetical protein